MDDDSFEDSFESSSDSETQYDVSHDVIPAYTDRDDFSQSYPATLTVSSALVQPRIHTQSIPVEPEAAGSVMHGIKLSLSPKFSPKSKKKFRPHFKKPQGLGNITQKIIKKKKKVFGVNLQTAVYRSQLGTDDIQLPTVFRECLDYLEENGIEHQGLYRLGGVKSQIEGVKALYDKGVVVDLSEYEVNAVASLLKLYLRELPEPLIHQSLIPQLEAVASKTDTVEMQLELLKQIMDEVPSCNKLLLGWLLTHLSHISDKASINKMGISNLIIVFSPTLQIPIQIMHLLFNHRHDLFTNSEIKKYIRPQVQSQSTPFDLPDPDALETEEEIVTELTRLSDLLEKLHTKAAGKSYDEKDEYCWELQRIVTELRRRKKVYEKISASKLGDEQEFMKTLMIMDATLEAENVELKEINSQLKEEIRQEAEKIERYKSELRLYAGRERTPSPDNVDESEISKLLWKKRELQSQYNNVIEDIACEKKAILQLKVKLKMLPIENALTVHE